MNQQKMMERMNNGIQYRKASALEIREKTEDGKMPVEGYASTFNDPYTLYDDGEYRVDEQIDPHAFDECDMSDVIMQYDHAGRVFARTRNNTLEVKTDEHGLFISTDLSGTAIGRELYEEISGGYTDRMSFGFTVLEDHLDIDGAYVLRTITKIGKLYDVSAVSLPANDNTEISARSTSAGIVEGLKAEAEAKRVRMEKLKAECDALLGTVNNDAEKEDANV